jgi:hypothetical protein
VTAAPHPRHRSQPPQRRPRRRSLASNTILAGDKASLSDIVQGDLLRAEVVVAGTYTNETTLGGQLTAPVLAVSKIEVTGSAK